MEESKSNYVLIPKEINTQKRDLFITYRSNSQSHFRNTAPYNYEHRIRLNPGGEPKNMELRNHFPTNQIKDTLIKSSNFGSSNNILQNETAYSKAEIELSINNFANEQKHQNLLRKYKNIKNNCYKVRKNNKKRLENKKLFLKRELTRIIKDALIFSKSVYIPILDTLLILLIRLKFKVTDKSLVSFFTFSTISLILSGSIALTALFFLENIRASFIIRVNSLFKNNFLFSNLFLLFFLTL